MMMFFLARHRRKGLPGVTWEAPREAVAEGTAPSCRHGGRTNGLWGAYFMRGFRGKYIQASYSYVTS